MTEHKWAHILRAIADGKEVEFYSNFFDEWMPLGGDEYINPISLPIAKWRIKPTKQKKPMPTPHIHAAKMAEYAQDAAIDSAAWENWEARQIGLRDWHPLTRDPYWSPEQEYRRKPPATKMIKVTTNSGKVLEFPEPLRVAPAKGTEYFTPDRIAAIVDSGHTWLGDTADMRWLSSGLCHLDKDAAEQHAAALRAVNRGK